ncbi:MAG: AAA family ATPase [Colwelliaceae bacterium]|nr:AAA family ATPase [Colwelliaceae bacterium]
MIDNTNEKSFLLMESGSYLAESSDDRGESVLRNLSASLQETQINAGVAVNSNIIEKKQISILCVTLSLKSVVACKDEDLEVLDVLHRDTKSQCVDIAIRYGAFHAGSLGDTLLFYFGYPAVSDNDSRLCARTALDIASIINQRNTLLKCSDNLEIDVRMGVHTGIVSHYEDAMPEGGAINIAMELARLSRPRQVLCSQTSKRLLEGYIEFKMALSHSLGTKKEPEAVHQLVGERLNEAFGFLRGTRSAHAFVGREEELGTLKQIFDDTDINPPSYIHINGEAGIGKSRLIYEVRGLANHFQHYMCQCLPEHRYSGLHPILSIIKNKFNLNIAGSTENIEALSKSVAVVLKSELPTNYVQSIPLVLTWLNLPDIDNMQVPVLSAEIQKEMLFKALSTLLLFNESSDMDYQYKKLFLFEDVHWSDPTTLEFLMYFLKNLKNTENNIKVILTSREKTPEKLSDLSVLNINLKGFDEKCSNFFIKTLFNGSNISKSVYKEILSKTGGVPLYIEELVGMLVNKNIVQHLNGVYDFVNNEVLTTIPSTLIEFLQHKIDSLRFSKETLQISSAIGREFDLKLLIESSNKTEIDILSDLEELLMNELIYKQRRVNGDVYIFKHALVRDSVYESLNKEIQVSISNRISESLIKLCDINSYVDLKNISKHLAISKRYSEAIDYALNCLSKMQSLGLSNELLSFGGKVISWFEIHNDIYNELKLYEILLSSELMVSSYSSKNASKWSIRIRNILDKNIINDESLLATMSENIKVLEFLNLYYSSKFDEAKSLGLKLISEYDIKGDVDKNLLVNCFLSQIYQLEGEFSKAINSFDDLLKSYDSKIHRNIFIESDSDFLPYCKAMMSLSYIHNDNIDKAIELSNESVSLSVKGQYHISCVVSHIFSALSYFFNGQEEKVIEICDSYYSEYYCSDNKVYHIVFLEILHLIAKGELFKAKSVILNLYNSSNYFSIGWYTHFLAKKMIDNSLYDEAVELMELSLSKSENTSEVATLPIILNSLAYALYKKNGVKTSHIDNLLFLSAKISKKQGAVYFEKESRQILDEMK